MTGLVAAQVLSSFRTTKTVLKPCLLLSFSCANDTIYYTPSITSRRFRYKKKWAINRKPTGPSQIALDHFDAFYKPVYKEQWPLIRLSLLSSPKYCAVINKYSDSEKTSDYLSKFGAEDFVLSARKLRSETLRTFDPDFGDKPLDTNQASVLPDCKKQLDQSSLTKGALQNEDQDSDMESNKKTKLLSPEEESLFDNYYKDNVDVFVPTVKVLSAKDELMREELSVNQFEAKEFDVKMVQPTLPHISEDISAMTFPSGDVRRFPPSQSFHKNLAYYLMDVASVLPVLALNIQPTDAVLDMCSAPGGKSFIILQSLDFEAGGHLHCNDSSRARMQRLRGVLSSYFPSDIVKEVELTQMDGSLQNRPVYSKVLVDVPCNSDRHVVTEDDNNLFAPSRTRERLNLMYLQIRLLVSALQSCIVGGEVVYSTCTLAPAQNDGVIQATIERLAESSQIEVVVEDMSEFANLFKHHLNFWDATKYGQSVIPDLQTNSGPSYFAKLRRVK